MRVQNRLKESGSYQNSQHLHLLGVQEKLCLKKQLCTLQTTSRIQNFQNLETLFTIMN